MWAIRRIFVSPDVRIIREGFNWDLAEAGLAMKKFIPSSRSRRLMAAVVVGTVLSAPWQRRQSRPADDRCGGTDISRYCQVCWRSSGPESR